MLGGSSHNVHLPVPNRHPTSKLRLSCSLLRFCLFGNEIRSCGSEALQVVVTCNVFEEDMEVNKRGSIEIVQVLNQSNFWLIFNFKSSTFFWHLFSYQGLFLSSSKSTDPLLSLLTPKTKHIKHTTDSVFTHKERKLRTITEVFTNHCAWASACRC